MPIVENWCTTTPFITSDIQNQGMMGGVHYCNSPLFALLLVKGAFRGSTKLHHFGAPKEPALSPLTKRPFACAKP